MAQEDESPSYDSITTSQVSVNNSIEREDPNASEEYIVMEGENTPLIRQPSTYTSIDNHHHHRKRKTIYHRLRALGPRLVRRVAKHGRHWWSWHYTIDWMLCFILIICDQLIIGFIGFVNPYQRYPTFHEMNDATLSYPKLPDIVPGWALIVFAFFAPILVFFLVQIKARNMHDLHHATLGIFTTMMTTMVFTDVFKLYAGRLRPDFMARCFPDISGRCSNPNLNDVRDSRLSFPSGHSSISFGSMVYLSLYLSGKFRIYHTNHGQLWKLMIVLLPLFASGFIAVSRTRDYHHNFDDILAGGIIGSVMGAIGYFLNYPSLFDDRSDIPKNRFYRIVHSTHNQASPTTSSKTTVHAHQHQQQLPE